MRLLLLFFVVCSGCMPLNVKCEDTDSYGSAFDKVVKYVESCNGSYMRCFKEKMLQIVEKMRRIDKVKIMDGVVLVGNSSRPAGTEVSLKRIPQLYDEEINSLLFESVVDVLQTKKFQVNLNEDVSRALTEARKKKDNNGMQMLLPLLLLLGLKKKLFLLGLIAAKAFIGFKIVILIAAILIFYDWGGKKPALSVVSYPSHHDQHVQHHGTELTDHVSLTGDNGIDSSYGAPAASDGWNKGTEDAHSLAYNAYSHGGYP